VDPASNAVVVGNNGVITVSVSVMSSVDVPEGGIVTAKVDFKEVSNAGGVSYLVIPESRTKDVIIKGGGVSSTVSFTLNTTSNILKTAEDIVSQFYLHSVSIDGEGEVTPTIESPNTLGITVKVARTSD
jgi:hypothetical protein